MHYSIYEIGVLIIFVKTVYLQFYSSDQNIQPSYMLGAEGGRFKYEAVSNGKQ
jgi:hypothetical protein